MAGDFNSLESIFSMLQPADLLVATKVGLGKDPASENSIVRKLQRLLLEGGAGGVHNAQGLFNELEQYRTSGNDQDRKTFDSMINLYSTTGRLKDVTYPYMYAKDMNADATVDMITGTDVASRGNRDMSIIVSNSPFVSPMARDAQRVELFLNFLPSIVISQCVPYMELEFVFDRGASVDDGVLATAGLMKFLIAGTKVETEPDKAMYKSRAKSDGMTTKYTAGMEMFTSPQTLVNMNPAQPGSRYVDVLDPTRPFASLESVTITVSPTVGIMSYKKATAVIKLHDRSRLAEIADLIQPTTYTKSTVWLTYGWRHPYVPSKGTVASESYAEFINNNMLVREAYGVMNAGFSFDAVGQVTVTLELYTKSVSELRDAKVHDDENSYKGMTREITELMNTANELRKKYNLDPPTGLNKEIRGSMVLDAAEMGTFPNMKPAEIRDAINSIEKSLRDTGKLPKGSVEPLLEKLKDVYKQGKNKDVFDFKELSAQRASDFVKKKFQELCTGADPFLMFDEKNKKMKEETGMPDNPLLAEISSYNTRSDVVSKEVLENGITKKVVSFGKLFSVFMAPVLYSVKSLDEFQLLFYTMNDRCGPASSCNIAEFPIDVPVFLRQYKEIIEAQNSSTMTVEQFIKLAIDSQFGDIRSIGYGFRTLFKPFSPKERDATLAPGKKPAEMDTALSTINKGRGSFMMPQVEVYIETTHEKNIGSEPVDVLKYYESADSSSAYTHIKKILRIHVYDKTANPYKLAGQLLRSDTENRFYEVDCDEWSKMRGGDVAKVANAIDQLENKITVTQSGSDTTGMTLSTINVLNTANNQSLKHVVSKMVPSIIYGMNASAVQDATVQTKQDATLTAAQLLGLNSGRKLVATPQGGGVGGLPLKVIPASLSLRTFGCPLLNYSQLFFIDFNTGTTLDNIYGICGLTHTFTPGKFETSTTMAFYDAYGKYESAPFVSSMLKQFKTTDQ